jgi:hypothetical protein
MGLVVASILVCPTSAAEGRQSAAASTVPVTSPATTRHQMTIPAGFQSVTVGFRTALCESGDVQWVRQALSTIDPPQQPTTMPADLLSRIAEKRAPLKARIAADLALTDTAAVDKLFDETLAQQIQKLRDLRPPLYYLVCSSQRLKEVVKGGWDDPRFYYNRAADDVAYDADLRLTVDRDLDDIVMPAVYQPDAAQPDREKILASVVGRAEAAVVDAVARRAMVVTQFAMVDFIARHAIEPLKLGRDQFWFALGLEAVLSARYAAELTGVRQEDLLNRITRDDPRNPVRSATVDLLNPADPANMRRDWLPAYNEAFRVKSARVVREWLTTAGDSAVPIALGAIRATPPKDGAALVKTIHLSTGVDLKEAVGAR